ncbi:hypothetical protein ACFLV0_05575, partial [Chloroflexota bacterium]
KRLAFLIIIFALLVTPYGCGDSTTSQTPSIDATCAEPATVISISPDPAYLGQPMIIHVPGSAKGAVIMDTLIYVEIIDSSGSIIRKYGYQRGRFPEGLTPSSSNGWKWNEMLDSGQPGRWAVTAEYLNYMGETRSVEGSFCVNKGAIPLDKVTGDVAKTPTTPATSPTPPTPSQTTTSIQAVSWQKTYGGSEDEEGISVQQTTDDGYIIAGWTESYGAGKHDFYLLKTDVYGNKQWSQTFGGSGYDSANSVQQTTDGGYVVAGYTESYGTGDGYDDYYLVKTDEHGKEQWSQTYGGPDDQTAYSVKQTADGGYIVAGTTYSSSPCPDFYLVKTDEHGKEQWSQTYGGSGSEIPSLVKQTADGGYIIAGHTDSGDNDFYLVTTDAYGNKQSEQWSQLFGGLGQNNRAPSVQQTVDGGYIVAGVKFVTDKGDFYLVKTDEYGKEQWNQIFNFSPYDNPLWTQQTADGGYIITGTVGKTPNNLDTYLLKTDERGAKEWSQNYGHEYGDRGRVVQQTTDGGYIVAGTRYNPDSDSADFYLIKTDTAGN